MAAPYSIELLRGGTTANLTIASAPTGGITLSGWRKKVSDNTGWILNIVSPTSGTRVAVRVGGYESTLFKLSVIPYVNSSSVGVVAERTATITTAQNSDWMWLSVQIVPGTTWTIRLWYALGASGSIVGPFETTFAASTYGLNTGNFSSLLMCQGYTAAQNMSAWRVYEESSAPSNDTLLARKNSLSADSSAWADWPLTWTSGAAVLTDQSGNGRTLTAGGTLYQGAAGPIDAGSGGTSYTADLTESVGEAETLASGNTANVGVSDSEAFSESASTPGGQVFTAGIAESVASTENAASYAIASAPLAESEASAESAASGTVANAGIAEPVASTEGAAVTATRTVGVNESEASTESTATATTATVTASESEASAEALGTVGTRVVGVVESSGSSASVGSVVGWVASVNESEGVSEQVSVPAGGSSVEESIGDTGGVGAGARFSVTLNESEGITEGVAAGGVQTASVSETVASTATTGAAGIASAGLVESEGVAEGVGAGVAATQGLGEAGAVSETVAGIIVGESTIYTADLTETAIVVEYVTAPPITANVVPVIRLLDPLEMVRVFAVEDVAPVRVRAMAQTR
jgi:hypothetical protein